jgi:hypothetical protein
LALDTICSARCSPYGQYTTCAGEDLADSPRRLDIGRFDTNARVYYIGLTVILLAAGALRYASIGKQSMSHDEVLSIFDVRAMPFAYDPGRPINSYGHEHSRVSAKAPIDWAGIYKMLRRQEGNPPIFYFLFAPWVQAFGAGPAATRSLAAIIGLLSVLATALAASYLAGRRVGLLSAGLVAILPLHLFYSQDARPYSLLMLSASVSTYLFARALNDSKARWRVLLGASYVFGLYAHYYFSFLLIAQLLYVLVSADRLALLRRVGPVFAVSLALFLPWLPVVRSQIPFCVSAYSSPHGLGEMVRRGAWVLCSVWFSERFRLPPPLAVTCLLPVFALLCHCCLAAKKHGRNVEIIAWHAVVPWMIPIALFVIQGSKWATPRYYTVLIPGLATAVVWASLSLSKRVSVLLWLVLLPATVTGSIGYYLYPSKFELDKAARFIQRNSTDQALVVTNVSPSLFSYYVAGYPDRACLSGPNPQARLARLTEGYDEVCVFTMQSSGLSHEAVRHWLDSHMHKVREASYLCADAAVYRRR